MRREDSKRASTAEAIVDTAGSPDLPEADATGLAG